jgi:hypothetical protein
MGWFLGVIVRESGDPVFREPQRFKSAARVLDAPLSRGMTRAILGARA